MSSTADVRGTTCVCAPTADCLPTDNLITTTNRNFPDFCSTDLKPSIDPRCEIFGQPSATEFYSLLEVLSSYGNKSQAECSKLNSELLSHLYRLHLLNRIWLADEGQNAGFSSRRARVRKCLQKKTTTVGQIEGTTQDGQLIQPSQSGGRLDNLFELPRVTGGDSNRSSNCSTRSRFPKSIAPFDNAAKNQSPLSISSSNEDAKLRSSKASVRNDENVRPMDFVRSKSFSQSSSESVDSSLSRKVVLERLCRSLDNLPKKEFYEGDQDSFKYPGEDSFEEEYFEDSRLLQSVSAEEEVSKDELQHSNRSEWRGWRKRRLRQNYTTMNRRRYSFERLCVQSNNHNLNSIHSASDSVPRSTPCLGLSVVQANAKATNESNKSGSKSYSQNNCGSNAYGGGGSEAADALTTNGGGSSGGNSGQGNDGESESSEDDDDVMSSEEDDEEEEEDDHGSIYVNVDDGGNESSLDEEALTSLTVELTNDASQTGGLPFIPLDALREESMSSHLMNSLQSSLSRYIESSCANSYDLPGIDKFETNLFSSMQEVNSLDKGDPRSAAFLMKAIESGQFDFLKTFLSDSPELDIGLSTNNYFEEPKGETTALMEAANNGRYDLVKRLLSKGADVNAKSVAKNTALHFAALSGHAKVCSLLIRHGANIEDVNDNGHTPLMEAASAGHVAVAEVLLNHGAGVNAHSNEFKESALTLACYKGHLKMVEFLLNRGADKQHKTDEMHTALMEACMDGHVEVARLLLDHDVDVNMPPDSFESPLTLAACGGHAELVSLLIQRGANLEEINDEGYTPLMEAAREGHKSVVQILLENGANVNATTEETQETALSLACCGGSLDVVRLLIKEGANPNLGGTTPLMEAAQEGQLSVVSYLLQHGADIDIVSYNGDTALALACEAGHLDIANLLIGAGANVNKADAEHGRTALMRASRAGHLDIIMLLIANGADVNQTTAARDHTALSLACAAGHVHIARTLIKHGARVSQKLQDNSNCLIEAARGGHAQVINMLLKYLKDCPIDDDAQVDNGSTRLGGQMGTGISKKIPSTDGETRQPLNDISGQVAEHHRQSNDISNAHSIDQLCRRQAKLSDKKIAREFVTGMNNNGNIFPGFGRDDSVTVNSSGLSDRDERSECSSAMRSEHQRRSSSSQNVSSTAANKQNGNIVRTECDHCQQNHTVGKHKAFDRDLFLGDNSSEEQCSFVVGHVPAEIPLCPDLPATFQIVPQKTTLQHFKVPESTECCSRFPTDTDGGIDNSEQFVNQMSIDSCTDGNGDTPLTFACMGGYEDSVLVLLSEGADLEHKDKKGHTPLMVSCTAGHLSIVQILVAHGADLEATVDKTRDTCLSLSASSGQTEIVAYLINAGANKEHRNASDYTPLCLAASGGFVDTINVLLGAGAEINSRTNSKLGISPLMLAAMNGHLQATKLLLDLGADINAQIETNKNTALTLACYQGRCEVVSLLIERKANIEHRAKTGLTPLMEAASGGFSDVGAILIAKGADVNAAPVPSSRDTPLTIAADKGHDKFIQLLLDNNAYIDAKNKKCATALWLAASGGHFDAVQTLISRGANPDIEDARRISVLMAAFKRGHVKIVKFLVRHVRQFPSDTDCAKFIASCTDKDLQKRCKICMEVIMAAKDRQTQEADKAASNLLEELDLERFREESKRQAAAKKREKRKLKRQKRKQQQASLSSALSDMSATAVSNFAHNYMNEHVDDICTTAEALNPSAVQRISRDLLPDSPAEPTEMYPPNFADQNKTSEQSTVIAVNRKSRRRKRCNTSRGQQRNQTPRSQSSSLPHYSEHKEEQKTEDNLTLKVQASKTNSVGQSESSESVSATKSDRARTSENTDSKSSADEWTEVVGRQKKTHQIRDQTQKSSESHTPIDTSCLSRRHNSNYQTVKPSDSECKRSNIGNHVNWSPRSDCQATKSSDYNGTLFYKTEQEQNVPSSTQRSLSSGRSQYQNLPHSLSFAPSVPTESRQQAPTYYTTESVSANKISSRKSPLNNGVPIVGSTFSRRNVNVSQGKLTQRTKEDASSPVVDRIGSRLTDAASVSSQPIGQQRNSRGQNKAWKSLVYTPCSTSKSLSTTSYRSESSNNKTSSNAVAPPISDLEVFPELGSDVKCRNVDTSRPVNHANISSQNNNEQYNNILDTNGVAPANNTAHNPANQKVNTLNEQRNASKLPLNSFGCKPEQNTSSNYNNSVNATLNAEFKPDFSTSSQKRSSVLSDKSAMNNHLDSDDRKREDSADLSKFLGGASSLDFDHGTSDSPDIFLESRTFINKVQSSKLKSSSPDERQTDQEVEYTPFGHSTPFHQWSMGGNNENKTLSNDIIGKDLNEQKGESTWSSEQNVASAEEVQFDKAPGHKSNQNEHRSDTRSGADSSIVQPSSKEPNRFNKHDGGEMMSFKFDTNRSTVDQFNRSSKHDAGFAYGGSENTLPGGILGQSSLVNNVKHPKQMNSGPIDASFKRAYYHSSSEVMNANSATSSNNLELGQNNLQSARQNETAKDWPALINLHLNSPQTQGRMGPYSEEDSRTKFMESADKISNLDYLRGAMSKQSTNLPLRGNVPCMGPNRNVLPNRLLATADATCINQANGVFRPGWMAQQSFHHPVDMMVPPGLQVPYGMSLAESSVDSPPGDYNPSLLRNMREPSMELRRQLAEFCGPFLAAQTTDHHGGLCPPSGNRMEYGLHPQACHMSAPYRQPAMNNEEFERQFADSLSSFKQADETYFMDKFRQNSVFGWNEGSNCLAPSRNFAHQMFPQQNRVSQNGFQLLPSANVPSLSTLLKSQEQLRQASMPSTEQQLDKLWQQTSNFNSPSQILQSLSDDERQRLYQQLHMRQFSSNGTNDSREYNAALCNKLVGNRFTQATYQWPEAPSYAGGVSPPDGSFNRDAGEPRGESTQDQIIDSVMFMLMMQEQQKQFLQRAAIPTGNRIAAPQMNSYNGHQRPTAGIQFSANFVNPANTGSQVQRHYSPLVSSVTTSPFAYSTRSYSANNLGQCKSSNLSTADSDTSRSVCDFPANLVGEHSGKPQTNVSNEKQSNNEDFISDAVLEPTASPEFSSAVDEQTSSSTIIKPIGCERKKLGDGGTFSR